MTVPFSPFAAIASATGIQWSDFISYVPLMLNAGAIGLWLLAFMRRWIVLPHEVEAIEGERDGWKDLYLKECEAHERTRMAMQQAGQRADAAVEASRIVAGAIVAVQAAREAPAPAQPKPAGGGTGGSGTGP